MKITRLLPAAVVAAMVFPFAAIAGPFDPVPLDTDAPSIVTDDEWQFELRPYLWTVSLEGDVGMNGIVAPIDLSFGDILRNLDFVWAGTFSAQKGKWSFFLDSTYLKISSGIDDVPFPIFNTVGIGVEQVILSASVMYRIAEWDRGFLDVGAGAQYMYLKNSFNFEPSNSGIAAVSDSLAMNAVDRLAAEVRREVDKRIAGLVPPGPPPVGKPLDRLGDRIADRVSSRSVERSVRDTLNSTVAARANENLGDDVLRNGNIREKIRELASAAAKERIAAATSGIKSSAAKKAATAREKAERKLSQAIQKEIKDRLPGSLEVSEGWVDPFVVARVRHFLTDRLYLNAFGAYGGFGVGSDSMWQVGIGPGYVFNDWLTLEFYYRHMSVDYENDGFLFDADMSGLFLGAVINF